jgi:hypothetical protein
MVWAAASTGRTATWLLATLMQGETTSSGLDDAKSVAEIIGTLITALAVIVGAVWAYYRFVKGRTYRPRLEVSMGGEWLTVDGTRLLLARVRLRNIGGRSPRRNRCASSVASRSSFLTRRASQCRPSGCTKCTWAPSAVSRSAAQYHP